MTRNRWEEFAKSDAEFYIYSVDVDYTTPEGKRYFFESGRRDAERILDLASPRITRWGTALEIGCGVGRLAIPMAARFDMVVGVDISPTMLDKLDTNSRDMDAAVKPMLDREPWEKVQADFLYSYLVFQHIEYLGIIDSYMRRVHQALAADGFAMFQFDTRPQTIPYRMRRLVPDAFLPRTQRRGIRRIRRDPEDLKAMFDSNGLEVIDEHQPRTGEHWFGLKRKEP